MGVLEELEALVGLVLLQTQLGMVPGEEEAEMATGEEMAKEEEMAEVDGMGLLEGLVELGV